MKNITGLTAGQANHLADILADEPAIPGLPPVMRMRTAMLITMIYLRRNRTQADLAYTYGVSQPTISRTIAAMTTVFARVLGADAGGPSHGNGLRHRRDSRPLLPCWSWRENRELYSGKHKTTGLNLQVVTDLDGRLRWVSDPLPGNTHDVTALDAHDVLRGHDPSQWVADKGYIGRGMVTPIKKRPGQEELNNHDREYSKSIHKIRWVVEKAIANIKTWRALHTDYRRPLHTFETTISAIIGLHFYATSE